MLTREQLSRMGAMIEERYEALSAEIHGDAARSHDETYGELAGPVADAGDRASAALISDLNNAELDRDLGELRQIKVRRKRPAWRRLQISGDDTPMRSASAASAFS